MPRTLHACLIALAFLVPCGLPRSAGAGDWADVQREAKAAFKPVKLPSAKKIQKEVVPQLPSGIVIEPGPFDRLIGKLREPYTDQLDARDRVAAQVADHPGAHAGKEVLAALATLSREDRELRKRVADVEELYAEVADQGYMEASEGERRDRKLAAVLIPFYRGMLVRNDAVRARLAESVSKFVDGDALEWLLAAATDRDPDVRAVAAAGLGRSGTPAAREMLKSTLYGDTDAGVRIAALSGLLWFRVGDIGDAIAAALADPAWEIRALAAAACVRGEMLGAVGPLVEAIGKEEGRLLTDLDDALFALTGVRFYGDGGLWKTWWEENHVDFSAKAKEHAAGGGDEKIVGSPETWSAEAERGADQGEQKGATAAFYGIVTTSRRVLFLVDISRSMQDPAGSIPPSTGRPNDKYPQPDGPSKLAVARWQLHRAVDDLPDEARFNIVLYSESYAGWEDAMVEASAKGRKKAHKFIDDIKANGTTNIADPLDRAFELAKGSGNDEGEGAGGLRVDTVFLLSDGDPNRGRLSDLGTLLEETVRRNARARLVIHTVGIGEVAGSEFLRDLARRTGGRYVGFK